jgi:hypothetical protein
MTTKNIRQQKGLKRKGLITIYLEPELKEKFAEFCKTERVTMSSYLEKVIFNTVNSQQS